MADRLFQKGEVIGGRYELTDPLGKGAFGAVWRALDLTNARAEVAVKILFDKFRQDKKMLGRFMQEAKILEKLDHPNICKPLAWDAEDEDVFLAMEFIDGETLDSKFSGNSKDKSPVPAEGIAWICDQLCSAIDYAHENRIIHRDLKPKNVMVNRRGQRPFVKVLDFGIAKMLVGSEIDPTTVGRVLGSVLYIPPEQVLGIELTPRADIFSLGTILFELVTLKRAWARDEDGRPLAFHKVVPTSPMNSHVAVLRRIAREARPSAALERTDLSREADRVLQRAMAIKPDERFQTATEFALALRTALVGAPADRIQDAVTESVTVRLIAPDPDPPEEEEPAQEDSTEAMEPVSMAQAEPIEETPARTSWTLIAGVVMLACALCVFAYLLLR